MCGPSVIIELALILSQRFTSPFGACYHDLDLNRWLQDCTSCYAAVLQCGDPIQTSS